MRAVIDTQIWFRALIRPCSAPAKLLAAYRAGRFTVVASIPMLDELEDLLCRPAIVAKYNLPSEALDLVADLRRRADFVEIDGAWTPCRDPKDHMVIETAIRGRADALVSEDKDLTDDPAVTEPLGRLGIHILTAWRFLVEELGET